MGIIKPFKRTLNFEGDSWTYYHGYYVREHYLSYTFDYFVTIVINPWEWKFPSLFLLRRKKRLCLMVREIAFYYVFCCRVQKLWLPYQIVYSKRVGSCNSPNVNSGIVQQTLPLIEISLSIINQWSTKFQNNFFAVSYSSSLKFLKGKI